MSLAKAVLWGSAFLPRLSWWAYRRSRSTVERRWLLVEAAWRRSPAVIVYSGLAILGSWVYPLLTVHLPHHHYGPTPLTQTSTLRGRVVPALFLELTYHLEHHLYPQVPSHNLPKLSRRLDPVLREAGVCPRRVP
jgi:beta-carotene hydroxylase